MRERKEARMTLRLGTTQYADREMEIEGQIWVGFRKLSLM